MSFSDIFAWQKKKKSYVSTKVLYSGYQITERTQDIHNRFKDARLGLARILTQQDSASLNLSVLAKLKVHFQS